jgi:hypothetical protein
VKLVSNAGKFGTVPATAETVLAVQLLEAR